MHVRIEFLCSAAKSLLWPPVLPTQRLVAAVRELHHPRCVYVIGASGFPFPSSSFAGVAPSTLSWCTLVSTQMVVPEVEGLARIGVSCLQLLVIEAGGRFDAAVWTLLCATLARVFDESTPHELLSCKQYFVSTGALTASTPDALVDVGSARRLCNTPYGNGIVTAVRSTDGIASVSLSWGAVLHCPAEAVGITQEQLLEMTQQDKQAFMNQWTTRRSLSPSDFDTGTDDELPSHFFDHVHGQQQQQQQQHGGVAVDGLLPFQSVKVVTQCVVQLELVNTVAQLCDRYLDHLSLDNLRTLLALLETSSSFARRFNADR
jgi:hypothetical protein